MNIKVKRKVGVVKIREFSTGGFAPLFFADEEDVFEIPVELITDLKDHFDPYFPVTQEEKETKEFMLDRKAEE